tara:strand:+ start:288 stop:506 length:219 start_codon:yes stop_codon:yes gene_type:complete
MSTIQELRAKAQADGQELVKQFQELDAQKNEILAKQRQIEKQVDALNGEINAYNKIEPPVADAPNEAPPSEG